jgi:hypothetical protein
MVAVGALLPWMSLFAGLQSYRGIAGLYGRIAFVGGVLAAIGGVGILARPNPRLRLAVGGLGAALTLFSIWVLLGLRATTQHLDQHPFLLPRPEPGLFVVLAGAVILAALLWPSRQRSDEDRSSTWGRNHGIAPGNPGEVPIHLPRMANGSGHE